MSDQELKNEDVEVVVNQKPNCTVELIVTALTPALEKARKKAFKDVQKEVDIPGFRKGKAPQDLIKQKYPSAIDTRARNTIADIAFNSALSLAKIPLLNQNAKVNFNLDSFEESEAKLTFSYEREPEIPTVDPKVFKLGKIEETKIGKKELDEAVKQMLLFYSKWTPVTDRGAEEGDYVIIDLATAKEPDVKVFSDTRFEIRDQYMAKWMKKLILGKKAGDVVEGTSEPDPDASKKEKEEFEPKNVVLTLKKIEKAELPELNDEFAKKAGSENVEKLMEFLEKMLNDKANEKSSQEKRERVNRFLLETYPFELPLSLIQSEKDHRRKQMEQDPKHSARLKKMNKTEKEEMEGVLHMQSQEAVRLFYISRSIVKNESISVTHGEVQQEAMATLQMFGPVNVDPKNIPNEVLALALSKVILRKAQDFILAAPETKEPKEAKPKEKKAEAKKPKKKTATKKAPEKKEKKNNTKSS